MKERVLSNLNKEDNISDHKWQTHKSKVGIMYICNHENNVVFRLSPQQIFKSCTWMHYVRLHIAGAKEAKSAQQAKQHA